MTKRLPRIELVQDLLEAECQYSRVAWGIDFRVRRLVQESIDRGRVSALPNFLTCFSLSFDAIGVCRSVSLTAEQIAEFLEHSHAKHDAATEQAECEKWASAIAYFEGGG